MENLKDYSVLNGEEDDQVLHEKSLNVNMRMLNTSSDYLRIMLEIKETMEEAFWRKYADYNNVQGISGPNIGIPLRIIALRIRKEKDLTFVEGLPNDLTINPKTPLILFMLNPKVIGASSKTYTTKSNCGSLLLKDPIEVKRFEWIKVSFFDIVGAQHKLKFSKPIAATIQHEIDHLDGILILDKQKEEKGIIS